MFRLLLEGVYNNGEVIVLDIKWRVLSLLRLRIYSLDLDNDIGGEWVQLMPQKNLIKFNDFRGSIVWKYEICESGEIRMVKGWNNELSHLMTDEEMRIWVKQVSDVDFYKTIDRTLSKVSPSMESAAVKKE